MADKDWIEEIKVRGTEAVDRIRELFAEGNVRKVVLKKENGDVLFELPLTAGVLAGGAVTLMAPVIAAIGAAAAFLAHVRIEIHRSEDESADESGDESED
ncbi:MAG: DUF4342 domain-containing protein [Spirochaetaceae bacterium]|nr:DUF4342 domain-containing protein [Spirochaetaceae bacterium]